MKNKHLKKMIEKPHQNKPGWKKERNSKKMGSFPLMMIKLMRKEEPPVRGGGLPFPN